MAHFIEFVCAFGDVAAGFEGGDEGLKGGEVGGVSVLDGVAEEDDEAGVFLVATEEDSREDLRCERSLVGFVSLFTSHGVGDESDSPVRSTSVYIRCIALLTQGR